MKLLVTIPGLPATHKHPSHRGYNISNLTNKPLSS